MRPRPLHLVLAVLVSGAVASAGCTSDVGGSAATTEPQVGRCDPAIEEALTAWASVGFSGSFATTSRGEVECEAAVGLADPEQAVPNTPETVFEVGSVTKSFTAAAVFGLIEEGNLALADRAGDLVPGLEGPAAEATVEQLLVHTSGLVGSHGSDHVALDREGAVAAISSLESAFEPGTAEEYSNAGYTLLALIVEEVSGASYREHMVSSVLPLPGGGVAGGFWDGEPAAPGPRAIGRLEDGTAGEAGDFAGPHWALDGNGGLAMTVPELAAWTTAFFDGEVVTPESVAAMSEPRVDLGGGHATYGWAVLDEELFGEPALGASGGGGDVGHDAVTVWLPESRRTIAVASNTPDVTAEDLTMALGPALAAGEDLPKPDPSAEVIEVGDLGPFQGTYGLDGGDSIQVAADDGALELQPEGAEALAALFPVPADAGADAISRQEDQVLALLDGATAEGREERAALEEDLGTITEIELVGTIDRGELRTYVAVTADGTTTSLWYALEDGGSIAAVEIAELPSLRVVPTSPGTFRPERAGGDGSVSAVAFGDDRMVIAAGPATTAAVREP